MKTRIQILTDLIALETDVTELVRQLNQYPWDVEHPLAQIDRSKFIAVLQKCIDERISVEELILWANAIEGRDDIGFSDEQVQEAIFELANPEINGGILRGRLKQIIHELQKLMG